MHTRKPSQLLGRGRVEQPDGARQLTTLAITAHRQGNAVRGKGDRRTGRSEPAQLLPGSRAPEADGAVLADRSDSSPVRSHTEAANAGLMPFRRAQLVGGGHVPQLNGAVAPSSL